MIRPKRILLISNMYPSVAFPDGGIFVKNAEQVLVKAGFQVSRIVLTKTPSPFLRLMKYAWFYARIVVQGVLSKVDRLYVHYAAHPAPAVIALHALRPGIPIVTNVHGTDVLPVTRILRWLKPWTVRLLHISDLVIAASPQFKMRVVEETGIDPTKVGIYPSGGIDRSVFHIDQDRRACFERFKLDPEKRYIGYVGRVEPKKGWQCFVDAAAEVVAASKPHSLGFLVVGNGPDVERMMEYASSLGLDKVLQRFDAVDQRVLCAFYNCLEVFCFPTLREEGLGLVALEAMACGVPVVGSRIGSLPDFIVNDMNGFLVSPGDSHQFADAMLKVVNAGPEVSGALKKGALETASKYDSDLVGKDLAHMIEFLEAPGRSNTGRAR